MNDSSPVGRFPIKSTLGLENQPLQRPQLFGALAISVWLVVAALLAAVFGQGRGTELRVGLATAATVWSLADLLTAFLLLAQFYVNGRLLFGILAGAYAFDGFLTWPYLAAFPGLFGSAAPTAIGHQQISITLWMIWHASFPVLVACAALNDSATGRIVSRRTIRLATSIFAFAPLILAAGVAKLVFAYRNSLPHFVSNNHFHRYIDSSVCRRSSSSARSRASSCSRHISDAPRSRSGSSSRCSQSDSTQCST